MPKVVKLAMENKIYGYNLPQGVISQLYRTCAAGKPGTFSKVGLHSFVDPRLEGGRINEVTTKDIVKLVEVDGEEWLFYKVGTVDVAFIRGTTADPSGNISMETRGADPRQPGPGHGGQELQRHRHRPGGAHRRAGLAAIPGTSRFRGSWWTAWWWRRNRNTTG